MNDCSMVARVTLKWAATTDMMCGAERGLTGTRPIACCKQLAVVWAYIATWSCHARCVVSVVPSTQLRECGCLSQERERSICGAPAWAAEK